MPSGKTIEFQKSPFLTLISESHKKYATPQIQVRVEEKRAAACPQYIFKICFR